MFEELVMWSDAPESIIHGVDLKQQDRAYKFITCVCQRNTRSTECEVGFQRCKKRLHLLSGEGVGLNLISSRNNGSAWFVTYFSFPICRFPMDFPTVLTSMARFVAKITPNPWSFISFVLKHSSFIIASTRGNQG